MRGMCGGVAGLVTLVTVLMLSACTLPMSHQDSYAQRLPSQSEVAAKLAKATMPSELREQIVRLFSQNAETRTEAAYRLGKMGAAAAPAVSPLVTQMQDDTPVTLSHYLGGGFNNSTETTPGQEASRALAQIGAPAVNALSFAIKDPNPNVRRLAAKALGQIGELASVDFLIQALNDPDRMVQATAALALGGYRNPMAAQKIMDAYTTANASVRVDMVYTLANINDLLAVPFLIQHAGDPDPDIRAAVMQALGKIRDGRTIPALLKGLTDSDETARSNAAIALGSYYSPEIVNALIHALTDPSPRVCEAASESLSGLSGVNFGTSHERWQTWWQRQQLKMQPSQSQ